MNANQLINMFVRIIMRKVVNGGINAGVKAFSGNNNAGRAHPQEDRQKNTNAPTSKNVRQATRMARRITRL